MCETLEEYKDRLRYIGLSLDRTKEACGGAIEQMD